MKAGKGDGILDIGPAGRLLVPLGDLFFEEALKRIRRELGVCTSSLGISNVPFGLTAAFFFDGSVKGLARQS